MKILFRADSSILIGTGNVVRCAALAHSFKSDGHEVKFFSKDLPGNMNDWIESNGFCVTTVEPSHENFDLCVIDHYGLYSNDEDQFRKYCKKLVAIDDWGSRSHHVDLIVDPSISHGTIERKKANPGVQFEAGADWLMLREEFKKLHPNSKVRQKFEKILIFFGGTDTADQIIPYINAVKAMNDQLSHLDFRFLISKYHLKVDEIMNMQLDNNMKVIVNPNSVAELLNDCDFYIGSSGTITWERMCLGIPGLSITIVDNQMELAETLNVMGMQRLLGSSANVLPEKALSEMMISFQNPKELTRQSLESLKLVDGFGVERIKDRIIRMVNE